jgi:hypothetical protein
VKYSVEELKKTVADGGRVRDGVRGRKWGRADGGVTTGKRNNFLSIIIIYPWCTIIDRRGGGGINARENRESFLRGIQNLKQ